MMTRLKRLVLAALMSGLLGGLLSSLLAATGLGEETAVALASSTAVAMVGGKLATTTATAQDDRPA